MRRAAGLIALAFGVVVALLWLRPRRPAPTSSPARPAPAAPAPAPTPATTAPPAASAPPPPPTRRDGGAARVAVVVRAAWGSGPGQLGRRADPESVTVGPMSLLAGAHGLVVLDNVNQRLARFDAHGRPLEPIALPNPAAQDLARGAGDRVAVLDRLRDGRVTLYDGAGAIVASAALAGPELPEPAAVSGIFGDRDGRIVAEREHGAWFDLLDDSGRIDPSRTRAPGRPTRDGGFVSAALLDRAAGTVAVQRFAGDGSPRWSATVAFAGPLLFIALLDADAAGTVYLGVHSARESTTPPYALVDETLQIAAVDDGGRVLPARLSLPAPPPPEEAFRDLSVGDDGTIYWMRRTPAGVVIEAYRL